INVGTSKEQRIGRQSDPARESERGGCEVAGVQNRRRCILPLTKHADAIGFAPRETIADVAIELQSREIHLPLPVSTDLQVLIPSCHIPHLPEAFLWLLPM